MATEASRGLLGAFCGPLRAKSWNIRFVAPYLGLSWNRIGALLGRLGRLLGRLGHLLGCLGPS
eukprot:7950818-Pyramimonas_sp.AAC.1